MSNRTETLSILMKKLANKKGTIFFIFLKKKKKNGFLDFSCELAHFYGKISKLYFVI